MSTQHLLAPYTQGAQDTLGRIPTAVDNSLEMLSFTRGLPGPPSERPELDILADIFARWHPPSPLALNTPDGQRTTFLKVTLSAGALAAFACVFAGVVVRFSLHIEVCPGCYKRIVEAYGHHFSHAGLPAMNMWFATCMAGAISFLAMIFIVEQFRKVLLRPSEEFDRLQCDHPQRNQLATPWRYPLSVFLFLAGAGFAIVFSILTFSKSDGHPLQGPIAQGGIAWLVFVGLALAMLGPLVVDFGFSLCVATRLAESAIKVVKVAAEELTPKDEGWCSRVEGPALALDFRSKESDSPSGAIGLLSSGWGNGLAGLYVLFWGGIAPSCFTAALLYNATMPGTEFQSLCGKTVLGIVFVVSIILPLYFSLSVARISTACKAFVTQLNLIRAGDLDQHQRLLALETALGNLNQQQGLGFVMGFTGVVLDMRMLKQAGFTIVPVVATVMSMVLANYHEAQHDP